MKISRNILIFCCLLLFCGCKSIENKPAVITPNLAITNDGIYNGSYDYTSTPVKATVAVTVKNHQIIKIDIIKHKRSPIGKKAEKIIDSIIEHQSLDVDVISGATVSSITLLKAVENALQ